MKGASGANVDLRGDFVYKQCSDAQSQVKWFESARKVGLVDGVRVPYVDLAADESYRMEFIHGHMGTFEPSVQFLDVCLSQIKHWSQTPAQTTGDWDSYLERLEDHVREGPTTDMIDSMRIIENADPFPTSFCHGDMTLENVIIEPTGVCSLIDPNFKEGLFQSYMLDLGKLLQSTVAGYHRVFNSNHGVCLSRHEDKILRAISRDYDERSALISCLSHLMRLRKYRSRQEHNLVDGMILSLTSRL